MNTETIRREALSLPVQERAELAEQLLSSLDVLSEAEVEQLWLREAARRADEIDQGLTKLVPADDVRRQAQALLRSRRAFPEYSALSNTGISIQHPLPRIWQRS